MLSQGLGLFEQYKGFYNMLFNGKSYTGKTFTEDSKELIPMDEFVSNDFNSFESINSNESDTSYFVQDISDKESISFKQVSSSTYESLLGKNDIDKDNLKLFKIPSINNADYIDEIEREHPGFKAYYIDQDQEINLPRKNFSVSFDFSK